MSSPSIGRIVHYFPREDEVVNYQRVMAAIIVAVHSENCVSLKVFTNQQGQDLWRSSVNQRSPGNDTGCWDWPARAD